MNSMGVQGVLAFLLLFTATVKGEKGGVTFWGEYFKMTCPQNGTWYYKGETSVFVGKTFEQKYENSKKGVYYCEYDTDEPPKTKYYFYVQGKVCENCYELDPYVFGLVIVVDVLGTAFVMMIIYRYTKKKSSAGLTNASKTPARSGGRGPSDPSLQYEQLNVHTRSQDTYSIVNRMG